MRLLRLFLLAKVKFLYQARVMNSEETLKVQCFRFRALYLQIMAKIEYYMHKYVFISV